MAELPYNLGVGGALRTGFRYAAAHGYERAVQFDGDGQHNPAEIKTLLDALDDGAQLVVGTRFAETASDYQVGVVRRGAMGLLRFSFQLLSGHRFTDTSSGFKAFSAPVIQYFSRTYPVEYLSDTVEALLLACLAGFVVVEVPTTMRYRSAGAPSTRNLRLVYHYLRLLIVMVSSASLRRRPVL